MGSCHRFVLCAAVLAAGAIRAQDAEPEGPWYFVPVHETEVVATRTTTRTATFHRVDVASVGLDARWRELHELLARFGPCMAPNVTDATVIDGSFSLVPVVDTAVGRVPLSSARSAWTDFDGTVHLTPQGFLSGVNLRSQGHGPEVVHAIATTVARLATLAALRREENDPVTSILEGLLDDPEAFLDDRLACSKAPPQAVSSPSEALAIPPDAYRDADCAPFSQALAGLPADSRWALGSSHKACAALAALRRQAVLVDTFRSSLRDLLAEAPAADDPNGLRYERRFTALSTAYRDEYPKLEELSAALGRAIAAALSSSSLGGSSTTVHRARLALEKVCSLPTLTADSERTRCRDTWRVLDELGVALAGEPEVTIAPGRPGPATVSARLAGAPRKAHTFFFRQPIPHRFQLVRCTETATNPHRCAAFDADAPVVEWVLHPNTGIGSITMEQKAFTDTALSIEFSPLGVPATLRSSSTSSFSAAATSLAEVTGTVRDEVAATLAALVDIEEKQRQLGLVSLSEELERLESEAAAFDDTEVFETAGTSAFDASLAHAQAAAKLEMVRAELDIGLTQQTLSTKAAAASLALRVTALEQAVAVLERQLALASAHR